MPTKIHPLLIAVNKPVLNQSTLKELIDDKFRQNIFEGHDPENVVYVNKSGIKIAKGFKNFLDYKKDLSDSPVYVTPRKYFDLALEGGGSFGFAHLGAIHAFASKGIWFDRVSGTSAGSICAALIAAGYKIDLNYKIQKQSGRKKLTPSKQNSLNKILFEDLYDSFTDFGFEGKTQAQKVAAVRAEITSTGTFIYKFLDEKIMDAFDKTMKFGDLKKNLENNQDNIKKAVKSFAKTLVKNITDFKLPVLLDIKVGDLGIPGTFLNLGSVLAGATTTVDFVLDLSDTIEDVIKEAYFGAADFAKKTIKTFTESVVNLIAGTILQALILPGGNKIDYVRYSIFRLIEYGGFWNGDQIRDWIEAHLQAGDVNPGTGKLLPNGKKAITFKDLKTDLCITAANFGSLKKRFINRDAEIFFFSKKTTPDYPVAEAVRRSVSLPFVFIPRKMADGYGNIKRPSRFVVERASATQPLSVSGIAPLPPISSARTSISTGNREATNVTLATSIPGNLSMKTLSQIQITEVSQEYDNNIMLDGGFFQNLPISVFRDQTSTIFDVAYDAATKTFSKPLVISNINTTKESSRRPQDVPAVLYPEPIKSIKEMLGEIIPSGQADVLHINNAEGLRKVWRSLDAVTNYIGNSKESEISILLNLVPNSILVDIPLRDTKAEDSRTDDQVYLDSAVFDMPVLTKKWMNENSFNAAKEALQDYGNNTGSSNTLSVPKEYAPY